MVLLAFFIVLATYLIAYLRAMRHGFSRAGLNALVISSGVILFLTPVVGLGVWYFMVRDWPMNIGGKPNWTWYDNRAAPTALEYFDVAGTTIEVLFVAFFLSYAYACIRMLKARRAHTGGV